MLINEVQVDQNNVGDWSIYDLRKMQKTLQHNLNTDLGDKSEQKLLLNLMSIEIKRKIKIENINKAADKKQEWVIKNWKTVLNRQINIR